MSSEPPGRHVRDAEFVLKHGDISGQGAFNIHAATFHVTAVISRSTARNNAASGPVTATGSPTNTHFVFHFAS